MGTLDLRIKYRPVRIGWCIRSGNAEDMRRALLLTNTLWGGCFNPLVQVDDEACAKSMVEDFHVDALYPVSDDPLVKQFCDRIKHLPWPVTFCDLFVEGYPKDRPKSATFLDIYHPVRLLHEEHIKNRPVPSISASLYEWSDTDPLRDVLLAMFGAYPSRDDIGKDYSGFVEKYLAARTIAVDESRQIDADAYKQLTPSAISAYDLNWTVGRMGNAGIYVGQASNIQDIINFWNLGAAGVDLIFYDPTFSHRLSALRDTFLTDLREKLPSQPGWPESISAWSNSQDDDLSELGPSVLRRAVNSPSPFRSFPVKSPIMHFEEQSVLASVDDSGSTPSVSFELPKKPFFDETYLHNQHVVISVRPLVDLFREEVTFKTPFVPELNEYYGHEYHFVYNTARVEPDGIGIIDEITTHNLTLRSLPARALIAKIFEVFGMAVQPSQAGIIGARLIQQMGGLEGCRVFKITGVRQLIEKYSPLKWFNRSAAIMTIGQNDPVTGKPNFEQYKSLYIKGQKVTPEGAFINLVRKEVFRAGLSLKCDNCSLDFWLSLDDIGTVVNCEYCGRQFNITPQLRDRDWAYRRSGLFGREGSQEGNIPVALALLQIARCVHLQDMIYTTGMEIKPITAKVDACETDLAVITQERGGRVQLVIGECKTKGEISEEDIANIMKVADAFPTERINVYVLFAKTDYFSQPELERIRRAHDKFHHQVILLSKDELEPYHPYERSQERIGERIPAVSLEGMATATFKLYLNQKANTPSPQDHT